MTDPAPAPQAVPSRRRGELTLPPLPQLAEAQAELSRLSELVDDRYRAAEAARAGAVEAQALDAQERIAAIREQREPAPATEPEAQAAAEAADRELSDTRAALQAALEDVRARVVEGAPELRAALEEDQRLARRKLAAKVRAARQAAEDLGGVLAAVAWLQGVEGGRVRPFTVGRSLATPLAVPGGSGFVTAEQALDGLDAIAEGKRPGPAPLRVAEPLDEAEAS